ncbi:hypothetical protein [Actinoplanes sp. NPDC026619]|uniref:hypothetical protein n=1 Tax=Actinoplanes sp. NPDC026619 TaxID=3155798 RepID=UPI0033EB95DB
MTVHDDGVPPAPPVRRRRGLVVAGVVGLAAVLGAGSYVITDQLRNGDSNSSTTSTGQIDAIGTFSEAPATFTKPSASLSHPTRPATTSANPTQLRNATKPPKAAQLEAVTRTEQTANGTMRITTAKGDLAGQQDQRMAGDNGAAVGASRCTSKLRFANAAKPQEMPAVLLCWRTSAAKSVVTMAVSSTGEKPSSAVSAAVIAREWARLG